MSHVYRVSFTILLSVSGILFFPLIAAAAPGQAVFSGTVRSVAPCGNATSSYLVSFNGSAKPVVYKKEISQSVRGSVLPTVGQYLFGFSVAGDTCTGLPAASNQVISYYASTTPSSVAPVALPARSVSSGSSQKSGLGSNLSGGLLSGLSDIASSMLGSTVSEAVGGALSSVVGDSLGSVFGGGTSGGGTSFPYGALLVTPIPCTCSNASTAALIMGPPFPGTYLYDPSRMKHPFPYYMFVVPSVWHLGFFEVSEENAECWVGVAPYCTMIPITMGVLVETGTSMPGGGGTAAGLASGLAGAAGSGNGSGEKTSSPSASCPQTAFNTTTAAGKSGGEAAVRKTLAASGVSVTSSKGNRACNVGENGVTDGCTDVSGLQCGTMSYLETLASGCPTGSVVVTAGSESGHTTHNDGNAVDLSATSGLTACLQRSGNFTKLPNGHYVDNTTGADFYPEGEGVVSNTNGLSSQSTGFHYHVCVLGHGCK